MTQPRPELLLRPAQVILPDGLAHEGVVVLVSDGVIAHVGSDESLPAASRPREQLDLPDATLLPGLIDLHLLVLHAEPLGGSPSAVRRVLTAQETLRHMVCRGVTTVRDPASDGTTILDFRDLVNQRRVAGPRILAAGAPIGASGRGGAVYGANEISGPVEARRAARLQLRTGVDLLSVGVTNGLAGGGPRLQAPPGWQELRDDEIEAVVAEARALGLPVSANAISLAGIRAAGRAGVDTIEHASELDAATADLLAERGTAIVPTLTVMHCFAERGEEFGLPGQYVERAKRVLDSTYRAIEHALRAGVTVAAGTDSHGGESVADEVAHLAAAGLSTAQALQAATSTAARLLGPRANTGSIEVGRAADLLAVSGPIDERFEALQRPELVLVGGEPVFGPVPVTMEGVR